jgi:hypothetical protein
MGHELPRIDPAKLPPLPKHCFIAVSLALKRLMQTNGAKVDS